MPVIGIVQSRMGALWRMIVAAGLVALLSVGVSGLSAESAWGHQPGPHHRAAASKSRRPVGISLRYELEAELLDPGAIVIAVARCPRGYYAVGGGFRIEDARVQVLQSTPYNSRKRQSIEQAGSGVRSVTADAWAVKFNNPTTTKPLVLVQAVCLAGAKVVVK